MPVIKHRNIAARTDVGFDAAFAKLLFFRLCPSVLLLAIFIIVLKSCLSDSCSRSFTIKLFTPS